MKLETLPIADLLDYEFVIPNYQRGYRWDKEQIEALLEDLKNFQRAKQKGSAVGDFYCLQPIVVVPDKEDEKRFVVVDGQQRLTSLYLVLKTLKGEKARCFRLTMDRRKEQEKYLSECTFATEEKDYVKNIDNFYIKQAYRNIADWKEANEEYWPYVASLLTTKDSSGFPYAAVIWYEIPQVDALDAFRRLNFGKIPLTPAELVKSVLLQTDCYPAPDQPLQLAEAQRRAMEWDEMEHRLTDPLFSAMVCRKDDKTGSGIDIVLDFVADKINKELPRPLERKEMADMRQDNYIFNVVDAWIKMHTGRNESRSGVVAQLWQEIQRTFNLLVDWFDNRQWYHLIGLLRLMDDHLAREFIREIYGLIKPDTTREGFSDLLRKKVGSQLRVPSTYKDRVTNTRVPCPPDQQGLKHPDLRYGKALSKKMIHILAAHNVWATQKDPSGTARFPFHLFQEYNTTSLEHIHPQNITDDLNYNNLCKWVKDREADAREAAPEVWEKLARRFKLLPSVPFPSVPESQESQESQESEESQESQESREAQVAQAIDAARKLIADSVGRLKELLASEVLFEANFEEATRHAQKLDMLFGDMAGIDDQDLHSIYNMALVSQPLNSALSNYHLDRKRAIAIERETSTDKATKTFVPPCTHRAFAKGFRPQEPGNMKFWQPKDREAYLDSIQQVYDYFTK